ncbi:unnamed protein product [Somion occarium]
MSQYTFDEEKITRRTTEERRAACSMPSIDFDGEPGFVYFDCSDEFASKSDLCDTPEVLSTCPSRQNSIPCLDLNPKEEPRTPTQASQDAQHVSSTLSSDTEDGGSDDSNPPLDIKFALINSARATISPLASLCAALSGAATRPSIGFHTDHELYMRGNQTAVPEEAARPQSLLTRWRATLASKS